MYRVLSPQHAFVIQAGLISISHVQKGWILRASCERFKLRAVLIRKEAVKSRAPERRGQDVDGFKEINPNTPKRIEH